MCFYYIVVMDLWDLWVPSPRLELRMGPFMPLGAT